MTGEALICRLQSLQAIEGADNICKVDMFGETIVTQKINKEGDLGILFDCETQLSHEFCRLNDLYDDTSLNVTHNVKGYISAKNRRIRPITLKGVKVSGLWLPINSIKYCFTDEREFVRFCANNENKHFNSVGDLQICNKYVSLATQRSSTGAYPNGLKKHSGIKDRCPAFKKHFDTQHWGKAKIKFEYPYTAIISEKLHGTSLRVGYHPVKVEKNWWQKLLFWRKYPEKYQIVVGTRNTIKTYDLDNCHNNDDLYIRVARYILSYVNLQKDETIYCEIVGYADNKPIMPSHDNSKLKNYLPKNEYSKFIENYGLCTNYSYGCDQGDFDLYIYRRTINDDELNINSIYAVPCILKCVVNSDAELDIIKQSVIEHTNSESQLDKHISEGVCIRLEKDNEIQVFKNKSFIFKVLEGIAKESDTYVDQEEVN